MIEGKTYLSVIVPIYKVEKYIERCVRSLFDQTLQKGIEFVFIDDCSPDKSIEILNEVLESYPLRKDQVKLIRNEVNKGLSATRQKGVDCSSGEYLIVCDSDDWVEPDMYEKMLEEGLRKDLDVVCCDYFGNYENKELIYSQNPGASIESYRKNILVGRLHNALWNKMFKRELFENLEVGFTPGLNYWEDVSVVPRLLFLAERFGYISKPFYHYNLCNSGSYTKNISDLCKKNMLEATAIVSEFINNQEIADQYKDAVKGLQARTLYSLLINSDKEEGLRMIAEFNRRFKEVSVNDYQGGRLNKCLFTNMLKGNYLKVDILRTFIRIAKKWLR